MKLYISIIVFISVLTQTFAGDWPKGVDSSTDVFQNYRGLLQIKISQLPSSFISVFKRNRIVFFEGQVNKTKLCEIRRVVEKSNNKVVTSFIYFNKKSKMLFKEIFETRGGDELKSEISLKQYVSRKLSFKFLKNETYKSYKFLDENNRVITKFTLEYFNNNRIFSYSFLEKPLFVWNTKSTNKKIDILMSYLQADAITYSPNKWVSYSFGKVYGDYTNKIIDSKVKLDLRYISSKGVEISLNTFRRNSSYNIYLSRISSPQKILKDLTKWAMPVTKIEQATGKNQKLLNELQLFINKLDSNDISFVKNQLILLKKSVAAGEIDDNRL